MGNYYGEIQLGGKISIKREERLLATLIKEGLVDDTSCSVVDIVESQIKSGKVPLQFSDLEAHNGSFEELEEECRKFGISYIRRSSMSDGCYPEASFWVPEMKYSIDLIVGIDDTPEITIGNIKKINACIDFFLKNVTSSLTAINYENFEGDCDNEEHQILDDNIIRRFASHVMKNGIIDKYELLIVGIETWSPSIPEIPPFEFVD